MRNNQTRILTVTPDSPQFTSIVKLADQNTGTLGFIPEEALRRGAEHGRIFAATDRNSEVQGYVWYSATQLTSDARVHHLCVAENCRRGGVGRALVDELKSRTKHLRGITLRCRRDNPACGFYRKVGFVPVDERRGRGKDAQTLTCFWIDHGHPDLGTEYRTRLAESKAVAVIDANVFFDLHDEQSPTYPQSRALQADWVDEWAALWITDELYNEIDRHSDPNERSRQRSMARCFPGVQVDEVALAKSLETITAILPAPRNPSDESDRRHVAAAVAAKADFFVTRDSLLLDYAPQIAESSGIEVASPLEFILGLDESRRTTEYHPARLAGSGISIRLVSAQDVSLLRASFLNHGAGETKSAFESRLRNVLCDCERARAHVVRDDSRDLALLLVVERSGPIIEIPLFRVRSSRLAATLARHLTARVLARGAISTPAVVLLTDPHCPEVVTEALRELGFLGTQSRWTKVGVQGLRTIESARDAVRVLRERFSDLNSVCDAADRMLLEARGDEATTDALDRTERALWPLKIDSSRLPSFIVPIQARWATHLFDEQLATQNLFAVDTLLALQCENVYYRAAKPQVVTAPGRVLWYVSSDRSYDGTSQIRACSRLDEVVVGPVKSVFKRYSRLGVYAWNNVLELAGRDPDAEIMAFRFSGTELSRSPIRLNEVRQILHAERRVTPQFTTALTLSSREFAQLYTRGFCAQSDTDHEQSAAAVRKG